MDRLGTKEAGFGTNSPWLGTSRAVLREQIDHQIQLIGHQAPLKGNQMKYLIRALLAFLLTLAPTFVEIEIHVITVAEAQQCVLDINHVQDLGVAAGPKVTEAGTAR